MEWQPDIAVGAWLTGVLDNSLGETMHSVVPRGYDAYVRIFHESAAHRDGEDYAPARWSDAASAFDTTMHPLAQWQQIVRSHGPALPSTAADGRTFDAPYEGGPTPLQLAGVMRHLTPTSAAGHAALWRGWGGLFGGYGTSGRSFFTFGETTDAETDPEIAARHAAMLNSSVRDPFNNVFQQPTWVDGILSREVSEGPVLELPDREHVLFRGDVSVFADPEWFLSVPWRDRLGESHGYEPSATSPSIIWPEDRAWVLVSEIDYDSTIVAGSRALINAIVADPAIEALEIPANADLSWTGDAVNN